jgi:hypothetical protein
MTGAILTISTGSLIHASWQLQPLLSHSTGPPQSSGYSALLVSFCWCMSFRLTRLAYPPPTSIDLVNIQCSVHSVHDQAPSFCVFFFLLLGNPVSATRPQRSPCARATFQTAILSKRRLSTALELREGFKLQTADTACADGDTTTSWSQIMLCQPQRQRCPSDEVEESKMEP